MQFLNYVMKQSKQKENAKYIKYYEKEIGALHFIVMSCKAVS